MKISVIVGSLRKDSYNRRVFECYKARAPRGVIFQEVAINDFPHYSGDIEANGIPQMVKNAGAIISGSDGILFFSPEYNYSIPGVLKNAIDWLSRLEKVPFHGMKASVLGASPANAGTARMQDDLRKAAVYLDMTFLNQPEIMIGRCHEKFNEQGELIDESTLKFLDNHFKAFKSFIEDSSLSSMSA